MCCTIRHVFYSRVSTAIIGQGIMTSATNHNIFQRFPTHYMPSVKASIFHLNCFSPKIRPASFSVVPLSPLREDLPRTPGEKWQIQNGRAVLTSSKKPATTFCFYHLWCSLNVWQRCVYLYIWNILWFSQNKQVLLNKFRDYFSLIWDFLPSLSYRLQFQTSSAHSHSVNWDKAGINLQHFFLVGFSS